MRIEDIDEALRQQPTWQPPPGFARRVARLAHAQADAPPRLVDTFMLVPYVPRDAVMSCAVRLAGLGWMLRQYWLLRSH
jgi:hypothetical protein